MKLRSQSITPLLVLVDLVIHFYPQRESAGEMIEKIIIYQCNDILALSEVSPPDTKHVQSAPLIGNPGSIQVEDIRRVHVFLDAIAAQRLPAMSHPAAEQLAESAL